MSTSDRFLQWSLGEPKVQLVQRLLVRTVSRPSEGDFFDYYEPDKMTSPAFDRGNLEEAFWQACKACVTENWLVRAINVGPDITVYYVGSRSRFEPALHFLQTQLVSDTLERHRLDRPLREETYLRLAYLCLDQHYARYCGWWRIDLKHQFFFFKTAADATRCLAILRGEAT